MEPEVQSTVLNYTPLITASLGVLGTLLGVMVTSFVNHQRSKLEHKNTLELKNIEFKRTKLEELHLLFQKWEIDLQGMCLVFIPVYKGANTAENAMKLSTENRLQEKGDFQKLQTILQLHFPELFEEFGNLIKLRDDVLDYCRESRSFKRPKLDELIKAQEAFDNKAKELKVLMAQQASEL
ncbi:MULTISPECIES: hypothetical protein [Vibrio harveyi group]|uniref:hypothetical protein n=1 Tax=Vibrio harveyi group TaxID=717610 RepID=UPI0004A37E60|nr:hypothetical protein [Vibrio parahaemolyticus]EGR3401134.1 hypothetical protein [Vibrio parahaemolyticus]ELJ8866100.1 hypothetical protein [Vibrio parahaemolyticus]KYY91270.1 hypothetical protein AW029_00040 [Vibrio parahaemolyticus]MEA5248108.1 hypothetical protein [Vibrio parahaemolyticus]TXM33616.1 hypothetical protein FVP07_25145 [Vibrio parahaemolyticus]